MKTLKVPAAIYDQALDFCNNRLPGITELPPGTPWNPLSCPCANAVPDISVGGVTWCYLSIIGIHNNGPRDFVQYFDTNCDPGEYVCLPIRDDS